MIAFIGDPHRLALHRRQQTPGPSFAGSRQPLIRFIPAVFRQNESSCMPSSTARARRSSAALSRFIRHHVDIFQSWSYSPVLHDRQIDRTELIAYRFKVRPIPAVAAVINLCCGVTNRKLAHSVWLRFSPRPEKCRAGSTDGELVAGRYRLPPVRFGNQRPVHSPVAQMRSDPQRRNDPLNSTKPSNT